MILTELTNSVLYVDKYDFILRKNCTKVYNQVVQNLKTGGKKGTDLGFDEKISDKFLSYYTPETVI